MFYENIEDYLTTDLMLYLPDLPNTNFIKDLHFHD